MQNMMQEFLNRFGVNYTVIRDGSNVTTIEGMSNHEKSTSRAYIGFLPGADIRVNDILVNPANEKSFVVDVQTDFFQGQPHQLKAFYLTESEMNRQSEQISNVTFNIGTATGSIIGTGNYHTLNYYSDMAQLQERVHSDTSADKEQLEQIVALLQQIIENQTPVSKGMFSKFLGTIQRNSWLSGQITGILLKWLTASQL